MSEPRREEITLREEDGKNPPDLVAEIVKTLTTELHGLIPDAAKAGRSWLLGKSEQELAKVSEIKANALAKIGEIANENQRIVNERDRALREIEALKDKNTLEHEREMFRLHTERILAKAKAMSDAVAAIKALRELGVEVDIAVVMDALLPTASGRDLPPGE